MKLGLHTYSLYHHGLGQAWAGFRLPWERQLSTFQLFDLGDKEAALQGEIEAIRRSIEYCRLVLGVGAED